MTYAAMIRKLEAARRGQQRDAQKALRDLERQTKEQQKLSALEQARLEVEIYDKQVEVLLSIHKEQGDVWDWVALAASAAPLPPHHGTEREFRANQRLMVLPTTQQARASFAVEEARAEDARSFQDACARYASEQANWHKLSTLAGRILAGEPAA